MHSNVDLVIYYSGCKMTLHLKEMILYSHFPFPSSCCLFVPPISMNVISWQPAWTTESENTEKRKLSFGYKVLFTIHSTPGLVSMWERWFKKKNNFYKYEEKLIVFFYFLFSLFSQSFVPKLILDTSVGLISPCRNTRRINYSLLN